MNPRAHAKLFTGSLSPWYFHNHARAFLEAAAREFDAVDHISIPGYFLLGRAAELALKSYLLAHGASEADLRRVGHDLEEAMREAADLEISETCRDVLERLNPYYSGKDLEYPKTGFKSFPSHDQLREEVAGLLDAVAPTACSTTLKRADQGKGSTSA